jgi:tetratricopeptide (TPR) repeat protein
MKLLGEGKLGEAFDCFTEAIRLRPTSPVYHCNRAAVCLRLKRADLAVQDAAHAIQRDGRYLKAYLRGGRAHLQLEQPDQALELFKKALELDSGNTAAKKGVAEAQALVRRLEAQQAQERAAAAQGSRPGIPRGAVPEAQAAEQLYTAAQVLAANPRLQAARWALPCHKPGLGWPLGASQFLLSWFYTVFLLTMLYMSSRHLLPRRNMQLDAFP